MFNLLGEAYLNKYLWKITADASGVKRIHERIPNQWKADFINKFLSTLKGLFRVESNGTVKSSRHTFKVKCPGDPYYKMPEVDNNI